MSLKSGSANVSISDTTENTTWTLCVKRGCIFTNWEAMQSVYTCLSQPDSPLSFTTACPIAVRVCLCVSLNSTRVHAHTQIHIHLSAILAGRSEGVCESECMAALVKVEISENCSLSRCDPAQIWFTHCCVVVKSDPQSASSCPHTCQTVVFTPVLTKDFNPTDKKEQTLLLC